MRSRRHDRFALKQKDLSGFYTVDDITTEDDVLVIDELVQLTENHLKQLIDARHQGS